MGYVGVPPQSGFITTAKQRVTSSTNNYVDLDHSISSLADVIVWVNFVKQDSTNLSLTTSTRITLGGTLVSSDIVEIAYLGKAVATQTPSSGTVTNDMLAGSIANSKLANSSITLNGSPVSLGGSATVGGDNTPQFLATSSSTAISNTSHVAIINGTEVFDSNSLYNNSDGKFTVTASTTGYYFFYGGVGFAQASGSRMQASIYLNGSVKFKTEMYASSSYPSPIVSGVLNLSSSGDYVQLYTYQNTGSTNTLSGEAEKNFFGGFKIIT